MTSGIGKVDRTANATSQNVINADASFSGVDFETGDNVKVTVTPFSSVAGAGAEKSGTTTLSAKPNPFALTVNQPVSAAPSVPSFTFAAVDSTPIDGEAITGLSLTISQTDVSDQVIDLFNDHSGNWSAPTFSALTIAHGSNGITLNAGNEISLSFVAAMPKGAQESAQTSFTYNGSAGTSSFTAQSEVTFKSLFTASRLAGAIVSRDIVNDNEISVNLNTSTDLSGSALTDLYNANGTDVSLTLSPVNPDASNAVINSQSATLSALDQAITFDLGTNSGSKWDTIALLLTATSTYDASSISASSITQASDSINLINDLLTMSVTANQPSKGNTDISGVLSVSDADNNTPSFTSATADLYLNKNNSGNYVKLSDLSSNHPLFIQSQNISSLDGSGNATVTFESLSSAIDGHGLYIGVTATQTTSKADTHNFVAADSSANLIYKFAKPST